MSKLAALGKPDQSLIFKTATLPSGSGVVSLSPVDRGCEGAGPRVGTGKWPSMLSQVPFHPKPDGNLLAHARVLPAESTMHSVVAS